MSPSNTPVDIVITWVDTLDPRWREEFNQHAGDEGMLAASDSKNRPWDTFRYVLRGIERYCPWVRTVHFVTAGQIPEWMNVDHPKLHIVNHEDFIDGECLPTFNSRALELNFHRIDGLADNFVYFNDDMLVLAPLGVDHFFPNGKPAAMAIANALQRGDSLSHAMLNNLDVINRNFSKKRVISANLRGWFSLGYGSKMIRNLLLLPWPGFTGFFEPHLPVAMTKKAYREIWEREPAVLTATSRSRFRAFSNVNPYLVRYWQMCSGNFSPVSPAAYGRFFEFGRDGIDEIVSAIRERRHAVVCVNDGSNNDFETQLPLIAAALEEALPETSGFELVQS